MNTTKRELVLRIAENTELNQQQVHDVVQQFLDALIDSLAEGSKVELRNFGVFEVRERRSRVGRNPNKPAQTVTIPDRMVVKFKPGKVMKDRVGGGTPRSIPYEPTAPRD